MVVRGVVRIGFGLELHIQIGLKELVFVERVDADIAGAASAERFVRAPAVAVTKIEDDGIADRVACLHDDAFNIHPAVEEVRINQVRIERVLLGVLPERLKLPIVLRLQLPDAGADLISVALVLRFRMSGRNGTVVAVEVHREVAKNAQRYVVNLESKFPGRLEDHKAVDSYLVRIRLEEPTS